MGCFFWISVVKKVVCNLLEVTKWNFFIKYNLKSKFSSVLPPKKLTVYWRVSSTAKLILSTNCIIKHIPVSIRGITLCMSHKPNMQKKHLSGRTQLYPDRISLLILIRIQNFIDKGLVNTQNLLKKNVFKSVSFQSVSYLIT